MQKEVTRVAKGTTVERKRHVTGPRSRPESVVTTMTDVLQQNLAEQDKKLDWVFASLQRAVEEYTRYHRADTEVMDSKSTDIVGMFVAGRTEKQRAARTTSRQDNVVLVALHHSELSSWSTVTSARNAY